MNAFLLLYAMAIGIELVLSLLMALLLFLILSPRTVPAEVAPPPPAPPPPPAGNVDRALRDAVATISRGENDLLTLTNARMLLARYAREGVESGRQGGTLMAPGTGRETEHP